MKKHICLLFLFTLAFAAFAQTPNLINFQGIAKGTNGAIMAAKNISVRLSIVNSSIHSQIFYQERRSVQTNNLGAFAIQIGSPGALATSGSLSAINWRLAYSIRVEIDPNNGTNFTLSNIQALRSVPFAKYADFANKIDPNAKFTPDMISNVGAEFGSILNSSSNSLKVGNKPAVPTNSLVLPYASSGGFEENRPAIALSNTGTGGVVRTNSASSPSFVVSSTSQSAIVAESNTSNSEAFLATNTSSGPGLSIYTQPYSGPAIKAQSTNGGYALVSTGNVRFQGGNYPPAKGTVAMATETGEIEWRPSLVYYKVKNLSNLQVWLPEGGEQIYGGVVEYNNGNSVGGNPTFQVPVSGYYLISGKARVYVSDALLEPKLKNSSLFVKITNPTSPSAYRLQGIDYIESTNNEDIEHCLQGSELVLLYKGEYVNLFYDAETEEGHYGGLKDGSYSISLVKAK